MTRAPFLIGLGLAALTAACAPSAAPPKAPAAAAVPAAPDQAGEPPPRRAVTHPAPPADFLSWVRDLDARQGWLLAHRDGFWTPVLAGNETVGWNVAPGAGAVALLLDGDPLHAAGLDHDRLDPASWQHLSPGGERKAHSHHGPDGHRLVRFAAVNVPADRVETEPAQAIETLLKARPELLGASPLTGRPALVLPGGDGVEVGPGTLTFFLRLEPLQKAGLDPDRLKGWERVPAADGRPEMITRTVAIPARTG
ncbi:hypothetical protein [Caldinitratiruptor microaerophilus]|uniref:Lipoprotein n=1 Tax=Caldinitratiruptor microaerophilus TaxID=671077 RepID=A0AA35G729_9FIRM|nr:hypothetical protein [Caldinitratiruptor microaerophilus]BDG62206.1 hypothetical protein caldi_32960 [Caldinitratiruptor microaerophilus]